MESGESMISNKEMKVEIPSESEMTSPASGGGLARQGSIAKSNCLCSPTTHAGSFRCRLHRVPSLGLQRTKSTDSATASASSHSSPNANPQITTNNANTLDAQ